MYLYFRGSVRQIHGEAGTRWSCDFLLSSGQNTEAGNIDVDLK